MGRKGLCGKREGRRQVSALVSGCNLFIVFFPRILSNKRKLSRNGEEQQEVDGTNHQTDNRFCKHSTVIRENMWKPSTWHSSGRRSVPSSPKQENHFRPAPIRQRRRQCKARHHQSTVNARSSQRKNQRRRPVFNWWPLRAGAKKERGNGKATLDPLNFDHHRH